MKRLELIAVLLLGHLLLSAQSPLPPCQPIATTFTPPTKGVSGIVIKVVNGYPPSHNPRPLSLVWDVTLNGAVVQKGKIHTLPVAPRHSGEIRLPVRVPANPGEVFLNIYYLRRDTANARPEGLMVAREQFRLREFYNDLSIRPAGALSFTDEGGTFTITSPVTGLNLQFNKQSGWLQHYSMSGLLLARDSSGLTPDLGIMQSAALEPRLQLFSTSTSTDLAVVKADYLIPETPYLLHARYTLNAKGEMQVEQILDVDTTQPRDTAAGPPALKYPLVFGMKWLLPPELDSVIYYGADTATDNCHHIMDGLFRPAIDNTGARFDVRWWRLFYGHGHGLLYTADSALLRMHLGDGHLNIDRYVIAGGKDNYHYVYKVTPL
jgi:hypothetical protein